MKTSRIVTLILLVLSFGLGTTAAQDQEPDKKYTWGSQESPFCFWCPCANNGQGEWLCGVITFHETLNKNGHHLKIQANKLEGSETGWTYRISNVQFTSFKKGTFTMTIRTTGKGGLVTYVTMDENGLVRSYCH